MTQPNWYMNGLQQGVSYTFHVSAVAQDGTSRGESTNFRAMQQHGAGRYDIK